MAMHRVAGDDVTRQIEFLQKLLHGGDFVGFFIDLDVRQHQRGIDGERAEHLPGLDVVEIVETALQRLAVERDDANPGADRGEIQPGGMFAKRLFDIRRAEPLQDIADRRMRRRTFPFDLEGFVQLFPMHLDVSANASIRIGAAHHREEGKQQHVRQLVQFALRTTRVADRREERKQGFERLQGDLRDSVASDRFRLF